MKPVALAVVILATVMPSTVDDNHGVAYGRRFDDYLVRSNPTRVAVGSIASDLSDPPVNLYKVTQDTEEEGERMVDGGSQVDGPHGAVLFQRPPAHSAAVRRPDNPDDVLRGTELYLNTDTSSGFVLVRDDVPRRLIDGMFAVLAVLGWQPIEDDEATEPYEFDDGGLGVQIWLYRIARPVSAIVRDVTPMKAADGNTST